MAAPKSWADIDAEAQGTEVEDAAPFVFQKVSTAPPPPTMQQQQQPTSLSKWTNPRAPSDAEAEQKRLEQRQKQIDFGKNTLGYQKYVQTVPKQARLPRGGRPAHAHTPDKFQICSKRSWDGQIRKWRRELHEWDPVGEPIPPPPATAENDEEEEGGYDSDHKMKPEEDEVEKKAVSPSDVKKRKRASDFGEAVMNDADASRTAGFLDELSKHEIPELQSISNQQQLSRIQDEESRNTQEVREMLGKSSFKGLFPKTPTTTPVKQSVMKTPTITVTTPAEKVVRPFAAALAELSEREKEDEIAEKEKRRLSGTKKRVHPKPHTTTTPANNNKSSPAIKPPTLNNKVEFPPL